MINKSRVLLLPAILIILACNLPSVIPAEPTVTAAPAVDQPAPIVTASLEAPPQATLVVTHIDFPSSAPEAGLFYDVQSSGTAPERRAPYGDSYNINRLERPFLQDMTYIPDLDVETFSLSKDAKWFYVSTRLTGNDPNNKLGINYGVEIDTDLDGFGDFIILAQPPYAADWTADNVKVYADKNHNTSGLSPDRSDAPFTADGYETIIFDGGRGPGDDPDLAWVRINAGANATVQFAFKKEFVGNYFMFGVLSDAGLKDVTKLDYVDRFTEEEAGSPIKNKQFYPLQSLFAVDNTCREAYGFEATGFEPMLCPREEPTPEPDKVTACENPGSYTDQASCQSAGCAWVRNGNVIIAVVYYCTFP